MAAAYITYDDLRDRYGMEIDDLYGDNPGVTARAITDACGIIDGHIGVHVDLPLTTVPDRIKHVTCDLARYLLYTDQPPQVVRERYDDAILFLRRFADGKASLGVPEESKPSPTGGAVVKARPMVFDPDTLARMW